jgi:hypothetical protein
VSAQLDLLPVCRIPERGSQCYEILMAMQQGKRLTVAIALAEHSCYALSQRIGDLKRKYGWESLIRSRTVTTRSGARISEYWIDRCVERRA